MKEQVLKYIDEHREEYISDLLKIIRMPSADGGPTVAQEMVKEKLEKLGLTTVSFMGLDERSLDLPDFCRPDFEYDKGAYNLDGFLKGKGTRPSLMLFGHIDTEAEDYFGTADPYNAYIDNSRVYGLGASDDKGGIMMMIEALDALMHINKELNFDLHVLSILGKHGGAMGTLSALMKGYTGVNSIYLHPAETGHGFAEIKNISLGVLDLDIYVKGKPGVAHDDLDTGVSANVGAGRLVTVLEDYNRKMRKENIFDFGSFKGQPSFVLNTGRIVSDSGYGGIAQNCRISLRMRFFEPWTIASIEEDLMRYLSKNVSDVDYEVRRGNFNASPCMVDNDDPFVKLIEKNIGEVTGISEFIHQYHGGSDIRLPMLYGNSCCVGIGPSCKLPQKGSGEMEWMDVDDYIAGIRILASILCDYNDGN